MRPDDPGASPASAARRHRQREGSPLRDSANLDFVRSIAVLAVLLDHVLATLGAFHGFDPTPVASWLGRIGVLLFFVLMCLVLMRSLERNERRGAASALAFFVRRGFRIYPLALVTIGAVLLLRMPPVAWLPDFTPPGVGQLFANLSLSMNLFYADPVLSVLWSLPYELQMYLCLPFVYVCVRGRAGLRNAVLLWVGGVLAASVVPELVGRLSVAFFAPFALQLVVFAALLVGLPVASHRWVETQGFDLGARLARRFERPRDDERRPAAAA